MFELSLKDAIAGKQIWNFQPRIGETISDLRVQSQDQPVDNYVNKNFHNIYEDKNHA